MITSTDKEISSLAEKNPVLKGKTFVYGASNKPGTFNVFRADDPRVQLLTELKMSVAPVVEDLAPDSSPEGAYFYELGFENLTKLNSDLLVAYFGTQDEADAFATDPLVSAMPQVKEGRFAPIVGESFVMASSAPTVLSIPWMLNQYVPKLAQAAERVD